MERSVNLSELDEDQFADEVDMNLGLDDNWKPFIAPQFVRQTGEVLEELEVSLQMQIRSHGGDGTTDWERRIGNKLSLVQFRLRQARRRIREHDAGGRERESAWKAFAHELADAVEDSDLSGELDAIMTPFDDLSARQWLQRRRVKRGLEAA